MDDLLLTLRKVRACALYTVGVVVPWCMRDAAAAAAAAAAVLLFDLRRFWALSSLMAAPMVDCHSAVHAPFRIEPWHGDRKPLQQTQGR
jgi:hypothetical protein